MNRNVNFTGYISQIFDKLLFFVKKKSIDIGIDIHNTGSIFIWYHINTKCCSTMHHYITTECEIPQALTKH